MERRVQKEYHAVVLGHIQSEQSLIEAPTETSRKNMPLSEVCFERGKPAQTQMEVMSRGYESEIGNWTRVRLFQKLAEAINFVFI